MSRKWSAYITPTSSKGGLNGQFVVFVNKN